MALTATDYEKIKRLEHLAKSCGLEVEFRAYSADRNSKFSELRLVPLEENLPIYSRDTFLQSGTVEELTAFLLGWMKNREYLTMLNVCTEEKIKRKEQDYHNKRLLKMIKGKNDDKAPAPF